MTCAQMSLDGHPGRTLSFPPMHLEDFPRFPLGHWPTPLQPMERLRQRFDAPPLFIKRDDCTGLATGGNKTRKLEFLVADALRQGADTLLTHGAVQSNHVRQTAAAAAIAGLRCEAILEQRVADAPPEYHGSGNVFLDRVFGAELHSVPAGTAMDAALDSLAERRRAAGAKPYVIPGGGSNALGALGYVDCVRELQRQFEALGVRKPHIVHATGSAGTQAGLVAGIHALGLDWPVTGIGVRAPREVQESRVHDLALSVLRLLGVTWPLPREKVVADDRFIGDGYGLPTASMVDAVQTLARTEGILADPVYTGKGLAGLISMLRAGSFRGDEEIVFLHTGGSAGLFGYRWAFDPSWA